jgi:uncharacterized protein
LKKEYWFILIAYISMHLSSFIGVPLLTLLGSLFDKTYNEAATFSVSAWLLFSFTLTLIIVLLLLKNEMNGHLRDEQALPLNLSIFWAVCGIPLAFIAQTIAANIEYWLGIEMGSENTQQLVDLIKTAPIVILVTSILGPILEEIVFRKIIFGSLYKRMNFFFAGVISSIIFALAHSEPEHLLLYSAMGLTFAFLYVKTKRILVPIVAHVSMNTIVVVLQLNQGRIQQWIEQYEKIQSIIGGF